MKKEWIRAWVALVVVLVAIQFIPAQQTNPAVTGELSASAELKALLKRACYDCHSNQTVWPWYARIAPISWWLGRDVKEGRRELNFSTWDLYSADRKVRKLEQTREQIEKGKMPLWYYVIVNPDAKLSLGDRELILNWTKQP